MTKLDLKNRISLVGSLGLALALGTGCPGPAAQTRDTAVVDSAPGWRATFPSELVHVSLKSAAAYMPGATPLNLDSISPSNSSPNATGVWTVQPNKQDPFRGRVIFQDPVPGIVTNPTAKQQPFLRKEGSISASITVPREMVDARMSVKVNVTGGPAGKGSFSRQGPMLRWTGGTEYMSCLVDFATSEVFLWAGRNEFKYETLGKQSAALDNKKSYRVDLEVRGQQVQCKVFDEATKMVADTGTIVDAKMPAKGSSGVLFELSQGKLDSPLEGSASEIETAAL
jgi:hypothetical protein